MIAVCIAFIVPVGVASAIYQGVRRSQPLVQPLHRGHVAPEVHAAVAVQFLQKTLQSAPFVLRALLRHRYSRDQILQYRPDIFQGRDDINGARGQRAWHLPELGGGRVRV